MITYEATGEEQWKLDHWGKFSASKIYLLDGYGKPVVKGGHKELFSTGGLSYIKDVAKEAYTTYNDRDEVETLAMKNGKIDEVFAFRHLKRCLGRKELHHFGGTNPLFMHYCKDSGASPDALMLKGSTVSLGAELKCPTGKTYFDYALEIKDEAALRAELPDYWAQVQFSMMTFKCDLWLWCAYNEFYPPESRMIIIEVPADIQWMREMDIKLKQAVKIKYQMLEDIKKRFA